MPKLGRRRQLGFGLTETMIASTVLAMSAMTLAGSWSMSARASRSSQRAMAVQQSLRSVYESLGDVAYEQLLSWDGVQVQRNGHRVEVQVDLVSVGLLQLELAAVDDASGAIVARLETLRSGEY